VLLLVLTLFKFQWKQRGAPQRGRHTNENIFVQYLNGKSVFKDRDVLSPSFLPERLLHRMEQISHIASILAPALKNQRTSNLLFLGKTGTGKTATAKYIGQQFSTIICEKGLNNLEYIYINCQMVDTHYGILHEISRRFFTKEEQESGVAPPPTGWSLDRVFQVLQNRIRERNKVVVIVLDEIDKFVTKSGDDALYTLIKMNESDGSSNTGGGGPTIRVSIIGISNDLTFTELLDPRVRSRLSDEKLIFPPYDAGQLRDILKQRAELAFEGTAITDSVINLCAAVEAHEHGDARRAIDLLRVAGEIADRDKEPRLLEPHVQKARNRIELDCVLEAIKTLPTQSKLVLLGAILNAEVGNERLTTGELYNTYKELCRKVGMTALTQRRVGDLISELDMLGILNAQVRSYGRGGRTKEIMSNAPLAESKRTLLADEILTPLRNFRPRKQSTLD
jgi:cell division control protein 6